MSNSLTKIARLLLYSTVITPLIVAGSYYFPYITPKAVFFRIIIELVLGIWLYLWWRGKKDEGFGRRVKKNYFILALAGMFAIDFLASIFGYSFSNSFFSDIERSWGLYTLAHIYLFYFLARSFFGAKEWKIYLHCLLASVLYVAVYGIVQYYPASFGIRLFGSGPGRIMATLGNPAYTAMVLIFGMAICIYLFLNAQKTKLRYFYLVALAITFFAFTLTGIRGAYLGFLAGLAVAAILLLLLSKSRKIKIISAFAVIIVIGAIGSVFIFKNNKLIRSLPITNRLVTINLSDSTVITRLVGWRAALRGFKDNPVLGVGLENFNVVFNKYFDPIYYTYAPSEPYFDRAHNSYLDRLSMTGVLGVAAFFALIGVLIFYLYRNYKEKKITRQELVLFSGLTVAYLIHILFVFDDLSALLFFLSFLGLIEFRFHNEIICKLDILAPKTESRPARAIIVFTAFFLLFWFGLKQNWQIAAASKNEIRAIMAQQSDMAKSGELFQKALSVPYIPRNVFVTPFVDFLVRQANEYQKIRSEQAKKLFEANYDALKTALEEEHKKNKLNPLFLIKLSTIHSARWLMYRDPTDANSAINFIRQAIDLSPTRPQYYNLLAESYVIFGDSERAIAAAEVSYAMNKNYRETYLYLVRSYAAAGKFDKAVSYYQKMYDRGYFANSDDVAADLTSRLLKAGQTVEAREVGEFWLVASPNNTKALINLTIVALKENKRDEALDLLKKIVEIDPNFKSDVDYIIGEIKKGNIETLLKQLGQ